MPLDIPTPWVHGPNAAEAISSGGAAGEGAARIINQREESSARLAQDALQHNQQLQMESARLSQAEHLAQMEMQARKEVSQQNQLREQQRMAITDAYHQAEIGIEKGRLEQQQAVAAAKAKEAAMAFQQEQGFAQHLKDHPGDVIGGLQKFPRVSPSWLNAITTSLKKGESDKPVVRSGEFPLIEYDPKTHSATEVYTPSKASLSKADIEDLRDLRHERDMLSKKLSDTLSERIAPTPPDQKAAEQNRLKEINDQIEKIKRGGLKPPSSTASPESKFGHPKVGEVRAGFKFIGGDPNDQKNWEPVKEGE